MRILISGLTGLIGSRLSEELNSAGHEVVGLSRSVQPNGHQYIHWNPAKGSIDFGENDQFDGIIHLAGENVGTGRWTKSKKRDIRESRIIGTALLANKINSLKKPPKLFLSASAIGFYGNRGGEWLDETSSPGHDFLAEVCQEWEEEANKINDPKIRKVQARLGIVLSPEGGALKKMLFPFKMGAGGRIGTGTQYMSWISIDDVTRAISYIVNKGAISGPVNLVSPHPVTNQEYTKTLGRILKRPTLFPMPSQLARLAFGEMADALLLSSLRVQPKKLLSSGFKFQDAKLEEAIRKLLA